MNAQQLQSIAIGLRRLRKRLRKLENRLYESQYKIHTSYELFAFKDEGRQATLGHLPNLDRYDRSWQ